MPKSIPFHFTPIFVFTMHILFFKIYWYHSSMKGSTIYHYTMVGISWCHVKARSLYETVFSWLGLLPVEMLHDFFFSEWASLYFSTYYTNSTTLSLWPLLFTLLYLLPSFSLSSAETMASPYPLNKSWNHLVFLTCLHDWDWRLFIMSPNSYKYP